MTSRRQIQVGDEIRRQIGHLLLTEVKDPRIGMASVTEVHVSADLRHAHVNVSVYGDEAQQTTSIAALRHMAGFFRHAIGAGMQLRYTPELTFHLDDSLERGDRIMRLIDQVKAEREQRPPEAPTPAPAPHPAKTKRRTPAKVSQPDEQ
jgi:ribosome-binding factor A